MEKNVFKKICGSIDYNTYTKLQNVSGVSTIGLTVVNELMDKRNQNIEISSEMVDDKNLLKRKIGNHAISFAFKDGKSYFLDPTQNRIY